MKYTIVTFGCRVNQADSLRIEEDLLARGGVAVPPADADLVIVNTCSVTAGADQGARQAIRRVARDNPSVHVIVTGCYATRQPQEVAALPNVMRVVRNHEKDWLVQSTADDSALDKGGSPEPGSPDGRRSCPRADRLRGALQLRIIPKTRGAGRRLPIDHVLREVEGSRRGAQGDHATGVHPGRTGAI
jgi:threonylcarbamoyladenosine tRNA methylthiotransferase MtaB